MTKSILFDTDPGVDDAMALLFALASPEIDVVGLTTIFGNVHTATATENALRLLDFAGRDDIPVAHGADRPLHVPLDYVADFVHGVDGFGDIKTPLPASSRQPVDGSAAQFIVETIMARPGEITLVPVGPLTNMALALALEPRIAENVAEVVVMGGAATVNGNVNPAAEANIHHDPHAADRVFTAPWPVTMVGLDVTMQTVMTQDYLASLRGSRFGDFVWQATRFYQQFHERYHSMAAIHTHDPSAIAYVIDPSLFVTTRGSLRVLTEGIAMGQTLLDRRRGEGYELNAWSNLPEVNVCVEVESEQLLALYKERIGKSGGGSEDKGA